MTLACAPHRSREKCFMVRWANHNHLSALRPQNAFVQKCKCKFRCSSSRLCCIERGRLIESKSSAIVADHRHPPRLFLALFCTWRRLLNEKEKPNAPDANELARTLWINFGFKFFDRTSFPQVLLSPLSWLELRTNLEAERKSRRIKTKNRDDHYRNENIASG